VILLIGFGAVLGVLWTRFWTDFAGSDATTTVVRSTPSVIVAVRDLARLEGEEFRVERVIELSDKQSRLFGLIEAKDAILLVASGTITAGVDLSTLRDGDVDVDESRKTARITLPTSAVLGARLDNDKTYVFKRDTDLLASRTDTLETRARQEAEHTLRDAALSGGILQKSNDNVKRTVETLVRSLGYTTVTVAFRDTFVPASEHP
jgi:hypothetical protein